MNAILANVISSMMPGKAARDRFRKMHSDRFRARKPMGCHKVYGRVYAPIYDMVAPFSPGKPVIYNRVGERLDVFFLRDGRAAHEPYTSGLAPRYFIWDRFNFSLDTHFYTHWSMLETMGHPDRRYGCLIESESMVPVDYEIFKRYPGLHQDFDAIFTYSDRILNEVPNAKFFPFAAAPWFRGVGGVPDDHAYERKCKNVSFMASDKKLCDLHRYRITLGKTCKREGLADTYGTFDGGAYARIDEPYADYRYSIIVENDITPYYFSERLTSCFMAMTVPIYIGASKIGDFFNLDGMIIMKPGDDIRKIIAGCNERDYVCRLEAVKDNFSRACKYDNMWDWLYERYLTSGDKR